MADKLDIKRKGTMECTAQEGIQYLKENNRDYLLPNEGQDCIEEPLAKLQKMDTIQENKSENMEKVSVGHVAMKKTMTMKATLEEASVILQGMKQNEDHHSLRSKDSDKSRFDEAPKISRIGTMEDTAKSASHFLGSEIRGETRHRSNLLKQTDKADDQECPPALKKTKTMADTTEAAGIFLGSNMFGETRSATKCERKVQKETEDDKLISPLKKMTTMADTADIAKKILKDETILECRSQSKAAKATNSKQTS